MYVLMYKAYFMQYNILFILFLFTVYFKDEFVLYISVDFPFYSRILFRCINVIQLVHLLMVT